MNKSAAKKHLQFTAEIWTTKKNSPTPAKRERVQIATNDEFPFPDMKMGWSPEGDLQFSVFRKRGQQLKYVGKESTHTPGNLRAIPSEVLNRLAKQTSQKTSIHYEGADKIYPDHVNTICKAGLVPSNFLTMGDLWSKQDDKLDMEK